MKRTALILYLMVAVLGARADYEILPIETDEAMGEFIRFESRDWTTNIAEVANLEGGRLTANTTWTGEHVILNDLYVPSGVTLTLGPGTQVRFCSGTRIKIEDGGAIVLTGASGEEVVLTGYADETTFAGITLQSSSASYSDNSYVVADGWTFGKFATVSLSDTTAFLAGGQAIIPVSVSGSRESAFSFDWVAETNGVAFASGSMSWSKVGDGTKNITVPFDSAAFAALSNFTVRASLLRCCNASKPKSVVTLSEFITCDIQTDEAMGEFIRFESRDWTTNFTEVANAEGGRLTANTVWSNEHVIVSDVYIPSGVTLTLTADTVVRFCEGTKIKIEDGGALNIVGADGHDVILRGYAGDTTYTGIVKMSSGTLTDNSYVRVDGFTLSTLANVALHDSSSFRSSGLALIPVTVSGSRESAFSIDWVAETNGAPYKSGTMLWSRVSDGTKNISINYGSELDGQTNFTVRVAVHRACYANPASCVVKISDFIVSDIETDEAMGAFIRFESRDWTTNFTEVANTEGGRLTANTTWTGEHVILSDVYIPSGVTLTLAADALVRFCEGTMIKIEDGGKLNIVGAAGHDVILRNFDVGTTSRGIVKMSSGTYTDNMYVQYPDFSYGSYPNITLNDAGVGRDAGKVFVPITIGGTSRSQSFNVDWETDKGASGTVTWSQSSDGTKWIEIPVATNAFGGTETYEIRLTAARGANLSVAKAKVTIYEFDHPVTETVSVTEGTEPSNEFAVHGDIKTQPIFLNETEELRYSGCWQDKYAPEDVISRISVESDNGITRLVEHPGSEEGAITLKLADYRVGYYTLKHEIVERETEKVVDTVTKTFSVADTEDVEMHGGTLTQNETWRAGRTHVVYATVVVPSVYTLFIEPGAIVKFMSGTGITLEAGAALFANAIIFTHIDDDTIGGDTLSDGYTVAPSMDSYTLSGNFTFGADTELRYITQSDALTGTIGTQKVLSRGSTYRVSGTLMIASGGSLTIPSGTVLKMENGAAIVVNSGATLRAPGTRAQPITITSINDDSVSGKTTGSSSNPQAGDWDEIRNNGGTIELSNCTILYGGYGQYRNQGDAIVRTTGGRTTLENCILAHTNLRILGRTGGTMSAINCILADAWWGIDGAVSLVNGVIADCTVGSNGGSVTNVIYCDCETYSSASKVGHCVAYGETTAIQSGMIYADPLFVDAQEGDFRIREGSPCIDAADSVLAPETDYYGQPRITITDTGTNVVLGQLADIGICEVMPRNVTSDIDLTPKSVRCETNAVPGQLLFVKWEVANVGGAEVDEPWRDTISLVSADGSQEVTLGDKTTSSAIAVGGTVFCSAYFTVPAMSEGTWRPKVNVNSYHDVFEGMLTTNNVLVGSGTVTVATKPIEAVEDFDGIITGGSPKILKLAFGESNSNRMVRLALPAGVSVRWGFGFMPSASMSSGAATSAGGDVLFKVPEDATIVYVSLESDDNATFEMSFEDGQVMITGVSPNTLPSSGSVTITIDGAGFTSDSKVNLVSGAKQIAPDSVQYVSAEQLVATVDCAKLKAGAQYDLAVVGSENTATAPAAVAVAKVKGEGKLEAHLVLPDAARQGRVITGYIEYSNVGTADMNAPIFIVKGSMTGTQVGLAADAASMTNQIRLVGISGSYPAGRLKVGETARLPFYCRVEGEYSVTLCLLNQNSKKSRESIFSTWLQFCQGIADAVSDLNVGTHQVYDYEMAYDYAIRRANGDPCAVMCGVLTSVATGQVMPGRVIAAVLESGKVVGRATTDKRGTFLFSRLNPTNEYNFVGAGFEVLGGKGLSPSNLTGRVISLSGHDYATVKIRTICEGKVVDGDFCRVILNGENGLREVADGEWEDGICRFDGLRDGVYSVEVNGVDDQMLCCASNFLVNVSEGVPDEAYYEVRLERGGRLTGRFDMNGKKAPGVSFVLFNPSSGARTILQTDDDGCWSLVAPAGEYVVSATAGYRLKSGWSKSVVVTRGEDCSLEEELEQMPITAFPRSGPYPLPVVFDADFLSDVDTVSTYQWDLDGDGTIDSMDEKPRFTYESPGAKSVRLVVTRTDGSIETYKDANAVDVWDRAYVEPNFATLVVDDASGYQIVSKTSSQIILAYTHTAVPMALAQVKTIVVPGEETAPYAVSGYTALDGDQVAVQITPASLLTAYSSCRVMGMMTLNGEGQVCALKTYTTPVLHGGFVMSRNGKWGERGKWDKNDEVAIGVDFEFGQLTFCYAVEKNAEGKVCRSAHYLYGEWKPGISLEGSAKYTAHRNRKNPYLPGNPYRVLETPELTLPVATVPVSGKAGIEIGASAEASGKIAWHPQFKVDIGIDKAEGRDMICHDTFVNINKSNSFNSTVTLSGSVELACYAQGFLEAYIGKSVDKTGVKICDTTVYAGAECRGSMIVSPDRYVQDEYSMYFGGRVGLTFQPFEVGIGGLWSFSATEYKPDPLEIPIFKKTIRSPIPDMFVTHQRNQDGAVTVGFTKKSVVEDHWSRRRSRLDFGDGQSCDWSDDVRIEHSYSAPKNDKRVFTAELEEEYYYEYWPLSPVKACSYDIVVHGATDDSPTEEVEIVRGNIPQSYDPNEMRGPVGLGDGATQRYVKPGEWMTYTVYYENKSDASAAAQEVKVTNPLSAYLDWSTFEMGEVAFGNQIDLGLNGKQNGTSEVKMNGTNYYVRSSVALDAEKGSVSWYQRIVDKTTDTTWPADAFAGFLPPNDETFRGEGHLTYRIKVRDDAPGGVRIDNAATIVFDYNDPIETDPAWWNTVTPETIEASFDTNEVVTCEGSNIVVSVFGGSAYRASSLGLYLIYRTASSADLDLGKNKVLVDGVKQKSVKFPLTLKWAAGEVGTKTVTIPVVKDKSAENDETLVFQLANAQGMSLGEPMMCRVTIHDPGYDTLKAKIESGKASKKEKEAWKKLASAAAKPYAAAFAVPANAGKVSGMGSYAKGKKVTLKATANKGYVFMGWYPVDAIVPIASPVSRSASYSFTMPTNDVALTAAFITSAFDRSNIVARVDGLDFNAARTSAATNVWTGVYLKWPVFSEALSKTTVAVSGLPSGLKFTAKPIVTTKTTGSGKKKRVISVVTNMPANMIYGAPSAASKVVVNKKTKVSSVVPSQVKVTVTTAGKTSQTFPIALTVDPLPAWAVGTFAGPSYDGGRGATALPDVVGSAPRADRGETNGTVSVTIASSGKISAKQPVNGKSASFAASWFDRYDADADAFFATLKATVGKTVVTNEMAVCGGLVEAALPAGGTVTVTNGYIEAELFDAWQYNWKVAPWKALAKSLDKKTFTYVVLADGTVVDEDDGGEGLAALPGNVTGAAGVRALPVDGTDVMGKVTLKFAASGAVMVAGTFASLDAEGLPKYKKGKLVTVSAKGSATLVPVEDGVCVFVYLAPKGLAPHARCVEVEM